MSNKLGTIGMLKFSSVMDNKLNFFVFIDVQMALWDKDASLKILMGLMSVSMQL